MSTYCSQCDQVHSDTRKLDPWYWRCCAYPTEPGYGFVSPDYAPNPPYARCTDANKYGECPRFEPLREVTKGT